MSARRPGRPRGAQQDPAERRANLLSAAEAAIREHGPDASMEQIAERADVSKATLYDNFDGKAGLTEALLERYGLRLMATFAEAIGRPLRARQVVTGGLAIFVRFWFNTTPALPEAVAQAARAKAAERYDAFVAALGRRLASGPKLRQEISEDIDPTRDAE